MQRESQSHPRRPAKPGRLRLTAATRRRLFRLCVVLFAALVCAVIYAVATGKEISEVIVSIFKILIEVVLWL